MTRRSSLDWAALAELSVDGVITRAQLLGAGVSSTAIARSCQPNGRCRRLLPGVLLVGRGEPTRRQRIVAGMLYAGPGAVLTGLEAARRYGVRRVPDDGRVHLLVPHGCQVSSRGFLRVERTRRPPAVHRVGGLPTAAAARCLVDAARGLDRMNDVRAMMADAVQHDICDIDALIGELAPHGVPGMALPRRVLDEVADGVRSAAEAWARSLVRRSRRVPPPLWNVAVNSADGRLLAVVDAWWDDVGLAWEIDSREFHLGPAGYEATLRRHSALTAAGVVVMHTVPSRLRREGSAVLDEIERAYAQACVRRRPNVTAAVWRRSH